MTPAVVVATEDAMFSKVVAEALLTSRHASEQRWSADLAAGEAGTAVAGLVGAGVLVVVIGPDVALARALVLAETLDSLHPEVGVVLATEPTAEVWQQAARCGVRDVISPLSEVSAVQAGLERVAEAAQRRQAVTRQAPASPTSGTQNRVITVVSPKGGTGKTTVATNLAVLLASRAPGGAVLVDLDLQFGDVASALQLVPTTSMLDVLAAGPTLDVTRLKVLLTPYRSGTFVLAAPPSPVDADEVGARAAGAILGLLGTEFSYVVVDTASGLGEVALAAIEVSTDLVFVCGGDVPSIRATRAALDILDRLGITAARRHLVLNRADSRLGLSAADVETTLGMQVDVALPVDREVEVSTNQGSPVAESQPRSPVARQFEVLVSRFAPSGHVDAGRSPLRRRRKG